MVQTKLKLIFDFKTDAINQYSILAKYESDQIYTTTLAFVWSNLIRMALLPLLGFNYIIEYKF